MSFLLFWILVVVYACGVAVLGARAVKTRDPRDSIAEGIPVFVCVLLWPLVLVLVLVAAVVEWVRRYRDARAFERELAANAEAFEESRKAPPMLLPAPDARLN